MLLLFYTDKFVVRGIKINTPYYLAKLPKLSKGTSTYTVIISQLDSLSTIYYTLRVSACTFFLIIILYYYHSVPGKRPLPGKHPCTTFQGATVAASIQTYGILILGKHPCGSKLQVKFKRPWVLTRCPNGKRPIQITSGGHKRVSELRPGGRMLPSNIIWWDAIHC